MEILHLLKKLLQKCGSITFVGPIEFFAALILLSFLVFSCDSPPEHMFTKMTSEKTGVTFVNSNAETEKLNIFSYEYLYNGGGVSAGDINNDGLTDLYFTATSGENRLYLNEGDFRFRDITASSGTAAPKGWKTGVSMVDVDSDGFLDIYVCRSGPGAPHERSNLLFMNNGDLTFKESAADFGLNNSSYTTQSAFFDFDRDGDLDVFLLNHSLLQISNSFDVSQKNTTKRFPFVGSQLLRNDSGRFIDVSDTVGVFGPASNYGLGVSLSDLNNDGWIDIYAGCDYTGRDRLLLNFSGRFFDATDSMLTQISKFTMGTDIADANNDGAMDIFSLDMLPEDNYRQKQLMGADRYDQYMNMEKNGLHFQTMRNMLHLNTGLGRFSEVANMAGVSSTDWSWACLFADFDNDGAQDLFITNGFKRDLTNNDFTKFDAFEEIVTARKQGKKMQITDVIARLPENKIPNYMFRGSDGLSFSNVSQEWGLGEPTLSNGAAYADLDNDGDLDLVVNNINAEAGIYRNNAGQFSEASFLKVGLHGPKGNSNAIGARVTVYSKGRQWVREMLPVRGFQSSVDPVLHFGLGNVSAIDSVVIRWPNFRCQKILAPELNELHQVSYAPTAEWRTPQEPLFFRETPFPIEHKHIENDFQEFSIQPLLPRFYSKQGPAFAAADLNGDSVPDYYFGGAKGLAGTLYISSRGGYTFRHSGFEADKECEDVDAIFLDVDNDRDQDLYVVSGGYEFEPDSPLLQDRLYINDGTGNFQKGRLPKELSSGSRAVAHDYDADGFIDLFVGGRVVPGKFPELPASILYRNDRNGGFVHEQGWSFSGLVTDATWEDVNSDGYAELLIAGEWMGLKLFKNEKGKLTDATDEYFDSGIGGMWSTILMNDFDGDGDKDLLAGNLGTNSLFHASASEPMTLISADFDDNGSIDPLVGYFIQGKLHPYPTRDELTEQLPAFKKRFPDYHTYSLATIGDVLKQEETSKATKTEIQILETSYFSFENGRFVKRQLPRAVQMAPVTAMALMDVNLDGRLDVLCGGNISDNRARIGRLNSSPVVVLLSDGKGNFEYASPARTGIQVFADVKKIYVAKQRAVFISGNRLPIAYDRTGNENR